MPRQPGTTTTVLPAGPTSTFGPVPVDGLHLAADGLGDALFGDGADEVLAELGLENDPLFKLAMALEKIALEDDYFVSRKLYPNVDFYSGIVQRAIGIPVGLFTAVFALARTVGWVAQLNEMIGDPEYKIGRPRQLFTGSVRRDVQPIAQR